MNNERQIMLLKLKQGAFEREQARLAKELKLLETELLEIVNQINCLQAGGRLLVKTNGVVCIWPSDKQLCLFPHTDCRLCEVNDTCPEAKL